MRNSLIPCLIYHRTTTKAPAGAGWILKDCVTRLRQAEALPALPAEREEAACQLMYKTYRVMTTPVVAMGLKGWWATDVRMTGGRKHGSRSTRHCESELYAGETGTLAHQWADN